MITKHFFKTLVVFIVMILVGLLAVFLTSYFGEEERKEVDTPVGKMELQSGNFMVYS